MTGAVPSSAKDEPAVADDKINIHTIRLQGIAGQRRDLRTGVVNDGAL